MISPKMRRHGGWLRIFAETTKPQPKLYRTSTELAARQCYFRWHVLTTITGWSRMMIEMGDLAPGDLWGAAQRSTSTQRPSETNSPIASRDVRRLCRKVLSHGPARAWDALDRAERRLAREQADSGSRRLGDLMAVRAAMLAMEDDTLSAWTVAEHARQRGCSADLTKLSSLVLHYCAWHAGAPRQSEEKTASHVFEWKEASLPGSGLDPLLGTLDLSLRAATALDAGAMREAAFLARCGLRTAPPSSRSLAIPAIILACVHYEQGRFEEVMTLLRPRQHYLRGIGSIDAICRAFSLLTRIAAHQGDRVGAFAVLDGGCALADQRDWPRLLAVMLWERIRLCSSGDEKPAATWFAQLRRLAARHRVPARCALSHISACELRSEIHLFLTFGGAAAPHDALARLRHDACVTGSLSASSWLTIAEAQVFWIEGQKEQGLQSLLTWLRTAHATSFRQQAIDAGIPIPDMLDQLIRTDRLGAELLPLSLDLSDEFQRRAVIAETRMKAAKQAGVVLTSREQDVLSLVAEGRTNKAIAQLQGVAPETIKTHIKNIFIKLGVERRAQAVAKAQRLGQIEI